jgi:MoxR-like ATPase
MGKFQNKAVENVIATYFMLNENILLIGPSGTGKTMVVLEKCREAGRHVEVITGKEGLQDLDMLGAFVPTGEAGKYDWVDGPLARAFQTAAEGRPVTLLVDEVNRMPSKFQNLFIEAINIYDDGSYVVQNHQKGTTLKAPRDKIQFVATANVGQAGLNEIPLALVDRFNIVYVGYPDKNTELKILKETGLDEGIAKALVVFAEKTREMAEQMDLACGISTRSLVRIANQVKRLGLTGNQLRDALMVLMQSPIAQAAGVCETLDWKERASGLMQQFETILRNYLGRNSNKEEEIPLKPSRGRRSGMGVGASPVSI